MKERKKRTRASLEVMDYRNLMQRRIHRILLICSSYDAFTLEEDGRIDSKINHEYGDLGLSSPPAFIRAGDGFEALDKLSTDDSIDLVISMYNVGQTDVFTLSRQVKELRPGMPFVLLTHFTRDVAGRISGQDRSSIDYVFCWHGNPELILAIVKLIEDERNAPHDVLKKGVQAILLVEDSIRFYSSYLPVVYRLVMQQTAEFTREALNEQQQTMRKRSRPKIVLATNYNDAVELYARYRDNLLGVISDVGFVISRDDKPEDEKPDAGIDLCRMVRTESPGMPFLLQSSQASMRPVAEELGVGFLEKYSKNLLADLGEYIKREFLFGDFIFTDPVTGAEAGRASDLRQMQSLIASIPDGVLLHHTGRGDLSKWMLARGIFSLGRILRDLSPSDFDNPGNMRTFLAGKIRDYRIMLSQGVVAGFDEESYNENIWMARIGEGSLGGKGRGLAFMNSMLNRYSFYDKYPGVRIMLPRTVTVATDYFDEFIEQNGLQFVINSDISDEGILGEFVASRLPESLASKLRVLIRYARGPLAVRSSSKLEDSHYQPFAGIYSTYMIPPGGNDEQTLRLLEKAVKSVYASIYFASSRQYIAASGNMLSEEKMAVVIQEVCGTEDSGWFFPTISGVARSLNFYPLGDEKPEEGVAEIAVGLGKLVVDGGQVLRFSPRHPRNILQLSTIDLTLRETQRQMYVLDMKPEQFRTSIDDGVNLHRIDINSARNFRNMRYVASTWDMQNQSISDSSYDEGRKIITFAPVLKYDSFPLADILADLLEMGSREMRMPVEIEFAANMDVPYGSPKTFNFLQIRPIVQSENRTSLDWSQVDLEGALLWAQSAVGMGAIEGVCDVVYVRPRTFDSSRTAQMAEEVEAVNAAMQRQKRGYVLIGPGRWGSSDPWLGVPVKWGQISEAKVIVECGLENFRIEPSQGTHFFQNLVSFGVGYLTINPFMGDGGLDIDSLEGAQTLYEGQYVRHVRFPAPLYIFVDGRNNKAIIKA